MANETLLVLTNLPDRAAAERLAEALIERRLAACVNILRPCTSVYRWKGRSSTTRSSAASIKTTATAMPSSGSGDPRAASLRTSRDHRSPIGGGLPAYLEWVETGDPRLDPMLRPLTLLAALALAAARARRRGADDLLEPEKAFRFSARALDPTRSKCASRSPTATTCTATSSGSRSTGAEVKLGAPRVPARHSTRRTSFSAKSRPIASEVAIRVPVTGNAERLRARGDFAGLRRRRRVLSAARAEAEVELAGLSLGASAASSDRRRCAADVHAAARRPRSQRRACDPRRRGAVRARLGSGSFLLMLASFFGVRPAARVHAVRAADDSDPVRHHRRRGPRGDTRSRLRALVGLRARHGDHLRRRRRRRRVSGRMLAAALQNPWVLGAFAAVFVLLALSMFGFYELQLPAACIRPRLSATQRQACTAAARRGRGDGRAVGGDREPVRRGAARRRAALHQPDPRCRCSAARRCSRMALGMGVPLLVVGASAGALLPKAGPWMETVKRFFGVLLLGVAIWIVSPLMPVSVQMLAWAALLIVGAIFLRALDPLPHDAPGSRGSQGGRGDRAGGRRRAPGRRAVGSRDPLQPLAGLRAGTASAAEVLFKRVRSSRRARPRLTNRGPAGDARFLCRLVRVVQGDGALYLHRRAGPRAAREHGAAQADVTANTADHQALLKRFRLFGPPGIVFFDPRAARSRACE